MGFKQKLKKEKKDKIEKEMNKLGYTTKGCVSLGFTKDGNEMFMNPDISEKKKQIILQLAKSLK